MKYRMWLVCALVTGLSLFAVACGDDDDDCGDTYSSEEAYCCLNGAYYDCPTGDDAEACFNNFEPGECSRDSTKDGECDDGNDGGDSNSGGSGGGMGDPCSEDADCSTDGCIFENSGDVEGFCSDTCDSFSDCPDFWDCEEVSGSSHKYCIED